MGRLVEVLTVEVAEPDPGSPLLGAHVDSPAVGRKMAAAALEIGGWALSSEGPPDAVEAICDGETVARGAKRQRADLAGGFAAVPDASGAGFELAVDARQLPPEAELVLRARVAGTSTSFARLRLRRYWRDRLDPAQPPLVSILVLGERAEERALVRTLESIGRQRHAATEVLLLLPSAKARQRTLAGWKQNGVRVIAPRLSGPALRNEGIRRSNGQLLLFVQAGLSLSPDAILLGCEMLARSIDASALLDGDETQLAAALYRRSAFEELEGFASPAGDDCDLVLARRAKLCDAFFAPGSLVTGGG